MSGFIFHVQLHLVSPSVEKYTVSGSLLLCEYYAEVFPHRILLLYGEVSESKGMEKWVVDLVRKVQIADSCFGLIGLCQCSAALGGPATSNS